jgi:hypothetical protein
MFGVLTFFRTVFWFDFFSFVSQDLFLFLFDLQSTSQRRVAHHHPPLLPFYKTSNFTEFWNLDNKINKSKVEIKKAIVKKQ